MSNQDLKTHLVSVRVGNIFEEGHVDHMVDLTVPDLCLECQFNGVIDIHVHLPWNL